MKRQKLSSCAIGFVKIIKSQITSTKSQTNPKFQYPMAETFIVVAFHCFATLDNRLNSYRATSKMGSLFWILNLGN